MFLMIFFSVISNLTVFMYSIDVIGSKHIILVVFYTNPFQLKKYLVEWKSTARNSFNTIQCKTLTKMPRTRYAKHKHAMPIFNLIVSKTSRHLELCTMIFEGWDSREVLQKTFTILNGDFVLRFPSVQRVDEILRAKCKKTVPLFARQM